MWFEKSVQKSRIVQNPPATRREEAAYGQITADRADHAIFVDPGIRRRLAE